MGQKDLLMAVGAAAAFNKLDQIQKAHEITNAAVGESNKRQVQWEQDQQQQQQQQQHQQLSEMLQRQEAENDKRNFKQQMALIAEKHASKHTKAVADLKKVKELGLSIHSNNLEDLEKYCLKHQISLQEGDRVYAPMIAAFESTYELAENTVPFSVKAAHKTYKKANELNISYPAPNFRRYAYGTLKDLTKQTYLRGNDNITEVFAEVISTFTALENLVAEEEERNKRIFKEKMARIDRKIERERVKRAREEAEREQEELKRQRGVQQLAMILAGINLGLLLFLGFSSILLVSLPISLFLVLAQI